MARRGGGGSGLSADQNPQPPTLSYLQPEILPVQIMIDLLQKRGLKAAVVQQANREKIMHLFHKYISPKHQRDCRDNRRGKLMKKARDRKAITLKDDDWKVLVTESKGNRTSSLGHPPKVVSSNSSAGERLKPPPSCIDTDKKVIKLGGTTTSTKSSGGNLDFVIVKRKSSENGECEGNTKKQKLCDEKRKTERESESEKQKLNKHQNNKSHDQNKNHKKPKLDRKPISWP